MSRYLQGGFRSFNPSFHLEENCRKAIPTPARTLDLAMWPDDRSQEPRDISSCFLQVRSERLPDSPMASGYLIVA